MAIFWFSNMFLTFIFFTFLSLLMVYLDFHCAGPVWKTVDFYLLTRICIYVYILGKYS